MKLKIPGANVVVCRNCGESGHWTLKCQKGRNNFQESETSLSKYQSVTSAKGTTGATDVSRKYIPVHQREGATQNTMVSIDYVRLLFIQKYTSKK